MSSTGHTSSVARFNSPTFQEADGSIKAHIGHGHGHVYRSQPVLRHQLWPSMLGPDQQQSPPWDRSDSCTTLNSDLPSHPDQRLSFDSALTIRDQDLVRGPGHHNHLPDSPRSVCPPGSPPVLHSGALDKVEKKTVQERAKELKRADRLLSAHVRSVSDPHMAVLAQLTACPDHQPSEPPKRASSAPSSFKAKEAALQLVRKLASTTSASKSKLSLSRRWSKKEPPLIPHIDDFPTKPDLETYLNPSAAGEQTQEEIAELPGTPPSYTPCQDLSKTRTEINAPVSDLDPASLLNPPPLMAAAAAAAAAHTPSLDIPAAASKMMRCDHCQFGIKLEEQYFHCSICNNGDRIVCCACDAAGLSCRHELTERVRRVLRYHDPTPPRNASLTRHRQAELPIAESRTVNASRHILASSSSPPSPPPRPPAPAPAPVHSAAQSRSRSSNKLSDRHLELELKELALRKREQEVFFRERELSLAERESQLRIHEAETEARARQYEANTQTQKLMSQFVEMASLGAQFARSLSQKSSSSSASSSATDERDILGGSFDDGDKYLRQHAGKRKPASAAGRAGGSKATTPSRSSSGKASIKVEPEGQEEGGADGDGDGDEDRSSGTPKRQKLHTTVPAERLYACHFCKFDGQRYSELNGQEKHYRGCSSGYWPDISRLKQHLYRVHWRGMCCDRCYKTFKRAQDFENHLRHRDSPGRGCTRTECPFPEKFDDDKYIEIRRKRPTASPEEVWYIIYDVLFPGHPRPISPYAMTTTPDPGSEPASAFSSSSTPTDCSAAHISNAAQAAFAARLNMNQNHPQLAWLQQQPGAREFLLEQLQECMNDVIHSMRPMALGSPYAYVANQSPMSPLPPLPLRQLSCSHTPARPTLQVHGNGHHGQASDLLCTNLMTATSQPMTPAPSLGDPWLSSVYNNSHHHSFSRPAPPPPPRSHGCESTREGYPPTLISGGADATATAITTPSSWSGSEKSFFVPELLTPVDGELKVEADRYDLDSGSWRHGDDVGKVKDLGLAINTTFVSPDSHASDKANNTNANKSGGGGGTHQFDTPPPSANTPAAHAFTPPPPLPPPSELGVSVAEEVGVDEWLKPIPSDPCSGAFSGAGAGAGGHSPTPVGRSVTSDARMMTTMMMKTATDHAVESGNDRNDTSDRIDRIDMGALDISFDDFQGSHTDEFGNVNGTDLTAYLFSEGQT